MQGSTARASEKKLQENTFVGFALIQKLHNSIISETGSKKMLERHFNNTFNPKFRTLEKHTALKFSPQTLYSYFFAQSFSSFG